MSIQTKLYNSLFRRSSTFTLFIMGSVLYMETVVDTFGDYVFERINQGKLWEHIKPE